MAAVAFDPLEYTHQLEASGVPRAQAEVHARAMTAMFLHNFDALVTKDYLDVRLSEFETRLETRLDKRIDQRFAEVTGAKVGATFDEFVGSIALGRSQTSTDVANFVSWLAGPDSDYMTGQSVVIDGGMVYR